MTTVTAFDLIATDLDRVRAGLQTIGEGDNPILVQTIRHLFGSRGKYIRPALSVLVGRLFQPELEQRLIDFAVVMEIVHSASLVHDDTLDQAATRRGRTTVNAGWNGHIAILVGDYLFAQAAIATAALGQLRVMSMLAATIKALVRGELLQMETSFDWEQSEEIYFAKIGNKTASLLALCTEGAAVLSGAPEEQVQALRDYGYKLGLAFQIIDDILDLTQSDAAIGKPAGSDLAQGTITLPVIRFLRTASPQERELLADPTHVREAVALIAHSPALTSARQQADTLIAEALALLHKVPDNEARRALYDIADLVVHRTY